MKANQKRNKKKIIDWYLLFVESMIHLVYTIIRLALIIIGKCFETKISKNTLFLFGL